MQLLFFDAKITHALYNSTWNPTSEFEKHYVNQYNVSVRFLATQGGLSRWQHILDLAEDSLEMFIIVRLKKYGINVQYYIVILTHKHLFFQCLLILETMIN